MADPQGTPPPQGDQGQGDGPKYVTEEQLNTILNKAITARFTAYTKSQEKALEGLSAAISTKIEETLATRPEPVPGDTPKSGTIEESPAYKTLMKRLQETEAKQKQAEERAASEEQKRRDTAMRQRFAEQLAEHGIEGVRAKHAIALLLDSEKRVRYDDDGETLVFRGSDGDVDLRQGLKDWARSDDGKHFLPPRGTVGSGDKPGGGAPKKGNDGQPDRSALANALKGALTGI